MEKWGIRGTATAGMAFFAMAGIGFAQVTNAARGQPAQGEGQGQARAVAGGGQGAPQHPPGDLPGPIDHPQDLQDTAKMLFKLADTNNDGQISQKEATDAGNLIVGGFFFRADQNGDGTVTKEEARAARELLLQQQPMLRVLVQRVRAAKNAKTHNQDGDNATQNPIQSVASLLDSNNDKELQASEVRQAVQTTVQGIFATADTNRDGQLSPTELNAAVIGAGRSAMQASFQQADTNHDGQLSREEFDKALIEPANTIFAMIDANNDGQLSQDEMRSARQFVVSQLRMLRVPDAPNSPRNLIRTGQSADQVAPVPTPASGNYRNNPQGSNGPRQ
jgi:Ca2+-binding EF-hand superfamily protein